MAEETVTKTFILSDSNEMIGLVGVNNHNLDVIAGELGVTLNPHGDQIRIDGDSKHGSMAYQVLTKLSELQRTGVKLAEQDVLSAAKMAQKGTLEYFLDFYSQSIIKDAKGEPIRVKNFGQRQYVNAIQHNAITFGIGPAGTGKTYLAVVMAVAALKAGEVDRIIVTRPAVEAGESLGFLPGDLKEKVDPYLRPIYDALHAVLGTEHTARLMERGVIEIAPLAYMRGRTLDSAFAILDEAQNTTPEQMKMFLTRLGFNSKMIVNGDISQIDLPSKKRSGLVQVQRILKGVNHIEFIYFSADDVVRNPVVASIIAAYDVVEKDAADRRAQSDKETN
ncbi:PhoH family protein [Lacticaseibacillus pabuli]|uniref:PhoH-like protein n=1 Tax=Lacticaseibacillus pabuli TaxID=3025672 RepID=A0ABY7X0U0_9LACO|nr:PhoH family protein [Lacticaseibacillus sp. KACC 23028]WDF83785.1 PhoH family protein [Lacticaseibacillus sp. KACC 23028]